MCRCLQSATYAQHYDILPSMIQPKFYKALVVAIMVGVMMGFIVLIFSVLENNFGQAIAVASFAATTVSIFLNSRSPSNTPLVIFLSYLSAAAVGYGASLLPLEVPLQVAIAMFTVVLVFVALQWIHPPAVAYTLTFLLGGFGLAEVLFTIPALFVYFVTLGVVVLVVEQVAVLLGLIPREEKLPAMPTSWYSRVEMFVHYAVPLFLVVLFVSVATEFLYPELVQPYTLYLRILDGIIVALFAIDLTFIYRRSESLRYFVTRHWIDILATIPFFIVLRFFQGATLLVALFARGTAEVVADASRFSRFLRPLARTPRFARVLDKLDDVGL